MRTDYNKQARWSKPKQSEQRAHLRKPVVWCARGSCERQRPSRARRTPAQLGRKGNKHERFDVVIDRDLPGVRGT